MHSLLHGARRVLKSAGFLATQQTRLRRNLRFRDAHRGERCFILCNGPSVLKQDLARLEGEVVLSVSSGYLHRDFERIRPRYHFVPQISYGLVTEPDVERWFREMDSRIGNAELFLCSDEHELVARCGLFSHREVNYMCCARPFIPREKRIISLRGPIPGVASVSIMCLIAAMYMGFCDIYLLGTDHDSFATGEYRYAFEPTVLRGKDASVDTEGRIRSPLYEELAANLALWAQYRHLKRIAQYNQRHIYNATSGGLLDEFPRVRLEDVLDVPRLRNPRAT